MTKTAHTTDIIVLGAGNAALTAALAAVGEMDASRMLVIEKAPREFRGGNTRYSGGIFRSCHGGLDDLTALVAGNDVADDVSLEPYTVDDFVRDILRTTQGRADKALTHLVAERSNETLNWMAGLGINFEFNRAVGATRNAGEARTTLPHGAAIRAKHEGIGLSADLFRIAEASGIEIRYGTQALSLEVEGSGAVSGVKVRDSTGVHSLRCRALILACGGFQASPMLRTSHLGASWSAVKVRGTRYNTGDMISSAMDAGAYAYGDWAGCHATPIDADAPEYGDLDLTDKTNRLSYVYSIMVNILGERFVDEGEDFNLLTYAKMGRSILEEPAALAFQIFDSKSFDLLENRYSTGTPVEADTMADLAVGIAKRYPNIAFPECAFVATVGQYNNSVNEAPFDANSLDGNHTDGLRPNKSHWALRLDRPPFRAYAVTTGITFTFGGIKVNDKAEVIDQLGRSIPGLYATGEITGGFYYGNYPGAAGLTRGAVFGKLAGEYAAQYVGALS
jgi:tricarballylate dehydrogenase